MTDSQLVRKLGLVIALKLLILGGLWWAFVHGAQVKVDAASVAALLQHPSENTPQIEGGKQSHGQ